MSAIRSVDNQTELALRQALHAMGLRYRKHVRGLPGRPDIVFPRERVAIFVDGDYWHGRVLREVGIDALRDNLKKNPEYWLPKFVRNVERDHAVTAALRESGWEVQRYWESDVKKGLTQIAMQIFYRVTARRANKPG